VTQIYYFHQFGRLSALVQGRTSAGKTFPLNGAECRCIGSGPVVKSAAPPGCLFQPHSVERNNIAAVPRPPAIYLSIYTLYTIALIFGTEPHHRKSGNFRPSEALNPDFDGIQKPVTELPLSRVPTGCVTGTYRVRHGYLPGLAYIRRVWLISVRGTCNGDLFAHIGRVNPRN
jgi:hypothetical protein